MSLKSKISNYFEREFFYNNRKIKSYYLNETNGKIEVSQVCRARDYLDGYYNGENNILDSMLLKIEHMIVNLRRYGFQVDWYIDSSDINKFGTEKDKLLCAKKILEKHQDCFIVNTKTDTTTSSSGYKHWHLEYNPNLQTFSLSYTLDKRNNLKKAKFYSLDFESRTSKPVLYEDVPYKTILIEPDVLDAKRLNDLSYLKRVFRTITNSIKFKDFCEQDFDALFEFIDSAQSVELEPQDIFNLSKKLMSHSQGKRQVLKDLFHLRRIIKKIKNLDAYDYLPYEDPRWKYNWKSLSEKEVMDAYKITNDEFMEKRKNLYTQLSDLMYKKGNCWWD